MKTEQQPRDSIAPQIRPDFPKALSKIADQRHSYGPPKLHPHEVESDHLSILFIERPQPFQYRLAPCGCTVEPNRDLRDLFRHASTFSMYHYRYIVHRRLSRSKLGQTIQHASCDCFDKGGTR